MSRIPTEEELTRIVIEELISLRISEGELTPKTPIGEILGKNEIFALTYNLQSLGYKITLERIGGLTIGELVNHIKSHYT